MILAPFKRPALFALIVTVVVSDIEEREKFQLLCFQRNTASVSHANSTNSVSLFNKHVFRRSHVRRFVGTENVQHIFFYYYYCLPVITHSIISSVIIVVESRRISERSPADTPARASHM